MRVRGERCSSGVRTRVDHATPICVRTHSAPVSTYSCSVGVDRHHLHPNPLICTIRYLVVQGLTRTSPTSSHCLLPRVGQVSHRRPRRTATCPQGERTIESQMVLRAISLITPAAFDAGTPCIRGRASRREYWISIGSRESTGCRTEDKLAVQKITAPCYWEPSMDLPSIRCRSHPHDVGSHRLSVTSDQFGLPPNPLHVYYTLFGGLGP